MISTEKIEFMINFFPNFLYPIINKGRFNSKLANPVLIGVIIPNIMEIPLSPLLNTSWGIKNRLKAITIISEPDIIPTICIKLLLYKHNII